MDSGKPVDLYKRLDEMRMTESERALAKECLHRAEFWGKALRQLAMRLRPAGLPPELKASQD